MFDGFKSEHSGYLYPDDWQELAPLAFSWEVFTRDGLPVDGRKKANWKGLRFDIIPSSVQGGGYVMRLSGSFHKFHNQGNHNANDFGFSDFRQVVKFLEDHFHIDPTKAILRNLEIGVNLELVFPVGRVLDAIISHNDKPFQRLNIRRNIGWICSRDEYEIKVYDKARQSKKINGECLRIELKFQKMRKLNRMKVVTLSDLLDVQKVVRLGRLLSETFQQVIFFDAPGVDESRITERQGRKLEQWKNPKYWEGLERRQRHKQKDQFLTFVRQFSNSSLHNDLIRGISDKWDYLLFLKPSRWTVFHPENGVLAAHKKVTFSPLECTVKTSPFPLLNLMGGNHKKNSGSKPPENGAIRAERIKKRQCISCGRNISHQKKGSLFCGEKYRGKAAKACRNQDSTRRRTIKRKVMKARSKEAWLLITYISEGKEYSDTLHSSEIQVSGGWLDQVEAVKLLDKEPPETLNRKEAKKLLARLTAENAKIRGNSS